MTNNGNCPQIEIAMASWTITDCMGHTAVCSQTVTVVDTNPPTILNCSNIIETTCTSNVQVTWTVSAWDGCGGSNVTVTSTPPSGSFFNADTTNTVTNTAVDLCDNITNTCFFTVAVTRPVLGPISCARTGFNITLTWASGILQSCTNLLPPAPWVDVPGAMPPSFTTNVGLQQQYFRLRCDSP